MKEDIKALWTTALRSGDFQQGYGVLHEITKNGDKFCCLGVLCKLATDAGVVTAETKTSAFDGTVVTYGNAEEGSYRQDAVLPPAVQEWAGLDSCDPELPAPVKATANTDYDGVVTFAASGLNDTLNMSFQEIADIIDANL